MKKLYLILFISLIVLGGCSSNNKNVQNETKQNTANNTNNIGNYDGRNASGINNIVDTKNISNVKTITASSDLSKRASTIANDLKSLDNVEKATVIIVGNVALVGLNLSDNLSSEQINQIKKQAENRAVATDNNITNAAVTASPELVQSIANLANDVEGGKPLTGMVDELSNIIQRIKPVV